MKYSLISFDDIPNAPSIIRGYDRTAKRVDVRGAYKGFQCDRCKAVDTLGAIKSGLPHGIKFSDRFPDFFGSSEDMPIASARFRNFIEAIQGSKVHFYEFPSVRRYAIGVPERIIVPEVGNPAFRFEGKPCRLCGRFRWVGLGDQPYFLDKQFVLGAFLLQSSGTQLLSWVANEPIVTALEKERFSGVHICPYSSGQ